MTGKGLIRPGTLFPVLALTLLCASCGNYQEPELPILTSGEISAARLWTRMTGETDYTRYNYWPDHEGLRIGQSPHGAFHKVFVNQELLSAIPVVDQAQAPAGSMVVKENYNVDEKMVAITVMLKVPGYDPEHGDWFWAKYAPDGSVQAQGKVESCISCHAGAASNDYVIIGQIHGGP